MQPYKISERTSQTGKSDYWLGIFGKPLHSPQCICSSLPCIDRNYTRRVSDVCHLEGYTYARAARFRFSSATRRLRRRRAAARDSISDGGLLLYAPWSNGLYWIQRIGMLPFKREFGEGKNRQFDHPSGSWPKSCRVSAGNLHCIISARDRATKLMLAQMIIKQLSFGTETSFLWQLLSPELGKISLE